MTAIVDIRHRLLEVNEAIGKLEERLKDPSSPADSLLLNLQSFIAYRSRLESDFARETALAGMGAIKKARRLCVRRAL